MNFLKFKEFPNYFKPKKNFLFNCENSRIAKFRGNFNLIYLDKQFEIDSIQFQNMRNLLKITIDDFELFCFSTFNIVQYHSLSSLV